MALNDIDITILPNGTIRVVAGKFEGAKHFSAEAFMRFMADHLGGDVKVSKGHAHEHSHEGEHDHDHQKAKG